MANDIRTRITEVDGRKYEVIADMNKQHEMFSSFVQVYRLRADGSRGRKLMGHEAAWKAWSTVRTSVLNEVSK